MKRYGIIFGLLFPLTVIVSCEKAQEIVPPATDETQQKPSDTPEPEPEPEPGTATIEATLSSTKTYIGSVEGGIYKVCWGAGDRLSVNGILSTALTEEEAGSAAARFTVENVTAPYTVVYPPEVLKSPTQIEFPTEQVHLPGTFPAGSSILAVQSRSTALTLNHVCGFLKLSVTRGTDLHDIARIVVRGNASESISGIFSISFDQEGKPVVGEAVSGESHINLNDCRQTGEYLIAMPPVNLPSGLTVEIIDVKNHFMRIKTTDPVQIKSGVVTCPPAITFAPTGTYIGAEIEHQDFSVSWDTDNAISWAGGYGRVHRLNDGRLMAAYEAHVCNGYYRFSSDNGLTWGDEALALSKYKHTVNDETVWSNIANPEFAQLSSTHPHHPDRIIYAGNIRPSGTRSDLMPYSICYVTSDDGGVSWSERKIIYESGIWSTAIAKGCWEPFVLELPDGTVQIYFADETPYYRLGLGYQNISVIESHDGGDTWGEARIAAYTSRYRDGMPVVMPYGGNLYLAIEHYEGSGQHLHPQIVYTSIEDNWTNVIYGTDSEHRFDPLQNALDYVNNYYGAPYLIETDDFFVLSYQSSEGSAKATAENSVMEVVVCPKDEFLDGKFTTMRNPTRPVNVDQSAGKARWNSLCDLGGNEILAVSDVSGSLILTRGRIDK